MDAFNFMPTYDEHCSMIFRSTVGHFKNSTNFILLLAYSKMSPENKIIILLALCSMCVATRLRNDEKSLNLLDPMGEL